MPFILPWKRENLLEIWMWPHTILISLGGFWAEEASTPKLRRFQSIWRVITIFSCTFGTCSLLAYITKELSSSFTKIVVPLFTFTAVFQSLFNICFLVKHRKPLKRAMNILDALTRNTHHPEDISVIRFKLTRMWIIFSITTFVSISATLHWLIRPIYFAVFYDQRTHLMYDNWPVFVDTWTMFFIAYIYEAFNGSYLASQTLLFNSIFVCIAEYMFGHIIVLQNKFERLHLNNSYTETKKLQNIVNCHIKILQVCENLRISSEELFIIQTLVLVLNCCLTLFTLATDKNINITTVINILEVFLALATIYGLLCWYCSEIIAKCEDLRRIAYISDWLHGTNNQKKTLLILMTSTMMPFKFGGFVQLTLSTIISVLKATFSYYNFLITVLGKK